ncbi:hypothetical protein IFT73_05505 [Aeromicrobium sp. CFBP 8757]|uniref:hypothetical protein n=1 Tax=Aeromicrobium sp. CFBP 8757 TaxID=2775288 RepID=UPI00177EFA98|nr:hypothetical protein [Aeromicrobium sp. CFBP 8757]MBD8606303.1 hypothetical protein [Aeromicrobium sp. CFBP 8757]
MTTAIPDLLAAVPALDDPQQPFVLEDTLKLGGEKQVFRGRSTSKQFNVSFGGITKKDDTPLTVGPLVYGFETSRIEEPLSTFLEQHGRERRKGFLGGLFSR